MAKQIVLKDATSRAEYIFIQDSSVTTGAGKTGLAFNTASLVAYYVRSLGSATAITLATQTVTGAYSSGGFVEVDATNMPGVYRFDIPNAAFATGVDKVVVMLKGAANMAPVTLEYQLVGFDPAALTWLTPTIAGRTLDVSSTGEAGVDWANVGTPGSTVSLSATTVATVTTATTATNLTNERGKYAMGSVWIGPTANTSTTNYTDGIITNPVSTVAAAKTIADSLNMRRFEVIRTAAADIGASMIGYRFAGVGWTLTVSGGARDVGTSAFIGAAVSNSGGGTFASTSGTINWRDCEFATGVSVGVSDLHNCSFSGTLTLNAAGNYDFIDCESIVAGTPAPTFAVPAGTVNISFRRWSGGITISGITSGTTISIDMVSGGTVTLQGADGNVQVRGMGTTIDDQRTGTPTLGQLAFLNRTVLATPTNITAGTITTVSGNVTGSVGSVVGAVGSVTGNVGGNVVGTVAGVTPSTAAQVAAILTTQITESYRANGAAPTLAQFMSEVIAHLGEVSISGTTKTILKLDHATAAETFTLDSATTPAAITRAT